MNHDDGDGYFYNLTIVKEKNGTIDAVSHHILAPPPPYRCPAAAGNSDSNETRSSRSACQVC